MPPALACKFTVSELAVLRIVGDEVRQHGHCNRCVDEIAARAGVCRSMVKNAIREAARLGCSLCKERRREGRRNLPNVVRIVSKEWTVWLARGGRSRHPTAEPLIGVKKITPTDKTVKKRTVTHNRTGHCCQKAAGGFGSAISQRRALSLRSQSEPLRRLPMAGAGDEWPLTEQ